MAIDSDEEAAEHSIIIIYQYLSCMIVQCN